MFAYDSLALKLAKFALSQDYDKRLENPLMKTFFFLVTAYFGTKLLRCSRLCTPKRSVIRKSLWNSTLKLRKWNQKDLYLKARSWEVRISQGDI